MQMRKTNPRRSVSPVHSIYLVSITLTTDEDDAGGRGGVLLKLWENGTEDKIKSEHEKCFNLKGFVNFYYSSTSIRSHLPTTVHST